MRARTMAPLLGLVMAVLALAQPSAAQDGDTTTTTASDAVTIGDGIFLTGAVITPLGDGQPRTLDAYQAAVFVQSFLAQAFFGGDDIVRDPPADLPVYRVEISGDWAGDVGVLTVHYADDGTTPYVAFPGLEVTPTPIDPPPAPANWFAAPPLAIEAFNGRGELQDTLGTQVTTTTTESNEEAASQGGGSDSSTTPILVGAAVAAALVGGGLWIRRRAPRAVPDG